MGRVRDLSDQMWEAIEAGKLDLLEELISPDAAITIPGSGTVTRDELPAVLEAWLAGFPDMHHETIEVIEDGHQGWLRLRVTATHTGDFVTPAGTIPATGKPVEIISCDVVTAEDDRITGWNAYFNSAALMAQLGLA